MNRRDFLKRMAGLGGAAALGVSQIGPRLAVQSARASEVLPWRIIRSPGQFRNLWNGRWVKYDNPHLGWWGYRTVITRDFRRVIEFLESGN